MQREVENLPSMLATTGSSSSINEGFVEFSTVEKPNDTPIGQSSGDLVEMQRQAELIIDSDLQDDATSLHDIELKDIDLNIIELNNIDLRDIDIDNLQGADIAQVLTALQKQRASASGNECNIQKNVHQTATQVHDAHRVNADVIKGVYVVNKEPVHEDNSTTERLIGNESERLTTIVEQLQHHHTNDTGVDGPNTQISTDDGTLEFNVNELDERKLFELQNAIRELEGNVDFEQLLDEIKPQPAAPNSPAEPATQPNSLDSDAKPQLINASPGATNVNVDQIPEEAVYMSIGRLLDMDNVDMSSLSQGTQEQLMWLVNQLNNNRNHQDEDDEAGEEDYDKSRRQARIREENRERKKRWRESNQDRNKDNDLRCRVTKRATKLYGILDTKEKKAWMETEFQKRKEKREAKERARYHDNRLSTTPCFQSYPQQHHNHSGGSSAILSPSLRALPQMAPWDSLENSVHPDGISRNRESSVAESTTSSINDGDSPDTVGALNFLSDPETARKLLENPEAMELLSNNLEVLSFLQSVIGSTQENCPEGIINGNFVASQRATAHQLNQKSPMTSNLAALSTIPDVGAGLNKQRLQAPPDAKTAIDISIYFELSMPELEAKLETIDCEAAQKVITELLNFHRGEAAVYPPLPNMNLNPGALYIVDGEDHGTAPDQNVVNDRLISFLPNLDHDVAIEHTNGSSDNLDPDITPDASNEPVDISTKLLQALQGVLGGDLAEPTSLSGSVVPGASLVISQNSNRNKRTAPDIDQSLLLRKRRQSSPTTLISADISRSFTDFETTGSHLAVPATPIHRTTLVNTTTGVFCTPSSTYTPSRTTIPKPPVATSRDRTMSTAAAHAASFGNSAAMNQRLMPAPPYRAPNLGISYGGFSPVLTTSKKKADERLIKAMGFPPMLAGIGKKSTSL